MKELKNGQEQRGALRSLQNVGKISFPKLGELWVFIVYGALYPTCTLLVLVFNGSIFGNNNKKDNTSNRNKAYEQKETMEKNSGQLSLRYSRCQEAYKKEVQE